jgi:hypothetical protein
MKFVHLVYIHTNSKMILTESAKTMAKTTGMDQPFGSKKAANPKFKKVNTMHVENRHL